MDAEKNDAAQIVQNSTTMIGYMVTKGTIADDEAPDD